MNKKTIHMIRPGRTITANNMVEAYCRIIYYDKNASHIKEEVTCRMCRAAHERSTWVNKEAKKFA